MAEVEHKSRQRSGTVALEPELAEKAPAGGRLVPFFKKGEKHRKDFMLLRRQGKPAVKLAMPHAKVFKELWRLWLKKRVLKTEPSSTIAEINTDLKMPLTSVNSALDSMVRNGMVRQTQESIGWRGRRFRFTPTQSGVELLALAEFLGDGCLVQIGKKTSEWESRSTGEPGNLFQFAALIRGGSLDAEDKDAL